VLAPGSPRSARPGNTRAAPAGGRVRHHGRPLAITIPGAGARWRGWRLTPPLPRLHPRYGLMQLGGAGTANLRRRPAGLPGRGRWPDAPWPSGLGAGVLPNVYQIV